MPKFVKDVQAHVQPYRKPMLARGALEVGDAIAPPLLRRANRLAKQGVFRGADPAISKTPHSEQWSVRTTTEGARL
jgi:hypothetical protein